VLGERFFVGIGCLSNYFNCLTSQRSKQAADNDYQVDRLLGRYCGFPIRLSLGNDLWMKYVEE